MGEIRTETFATLVRELASKAGTESGNKLHGSLVKVFHDVGLTRNHPIAAIVTEKVRKQFEIDGAQKDLEKLEQFGVLPETVFAGMLLFTFLPVVDNNLKVLFGNRQQIRHKAKILRNAADLMDEVGSSLPLMNDLESSMVRISTPKKTADTLHFYANALRIRDQVFCSLNANSSIELVKYAIASAVKRITNKFHDREVSGVIGVFLRKPAYDETAHRVWRIRTLRRLEVSASFLPILLHALNSALYEPLPPISRSAASK
jgi:hypothetical protein